MEYLVDFSNDNTVFEQACIIRKKVFCDEQGYPVEEEMDEHDSHSFHFLGFYNNEPVACARILKKDQHWHLGRIAVLKEFRGKGLGSELVKYLVDYATNELKAEELHLSAQETAVKIYENVGFKVTSEPYLDGTIYHYDMVR
ncbi:GNAT family N-acetyltransferase [Spiroplasma monobiae]|uniref:Acetyltransferase, GNAT family protein n=1 Tax=Spiroplasma monobiae MQ-1 TaxID=1336748 RepID=A0A2K9LTM0_SPISQ|nr:GNAT family N-acetyltransferase [Spiroplasma monobiae]AUM62418.1 acetyltransferase, GNAT family protein [Spiroplasma monobiae MQ-1]